MSQNKYISNTKVSITYLHDIGPLKTPYNVLSGLKPDSQRYFDHHHSANDVFETIHKRELELGAATMTALVYLIDKYGIVNKIKL